MNYSHLAYPSLTSADAAMVLDALTDDNSATFDGPDACVDEPNVDRDAKADITTWDSLQAQVRTHIQLAAHKDNRSHVYWKDLINDVQSCLLAMTLDERRTKSLQLLMLAQSGAGERYHYLYHAMVTLVSIQGTVELPRFAGHADHTSKNFSFVPVASPKELYRAPTNFVIKPDAYRPCPPLPPLPTFQPCTSSADPMEPEQAESLPTPIKTSKSSTCHDKASSSKSTKVSSSKKSKSKKSTKVPLRRSSRLNFVPTTNRVKGIAGLPIAYHTHTPNTFSFVPVVSSKKPFRAPTHYVQRYPPLPHFPTFQPGTSFASPTEPSPVDVAGPSRSDAVSSPKAIKMSTKKSSTCHDKASSSKSIKVSSSKKSKSKKSTKVPSKRSSHITRVPTTIRGIDEVSALDVVAGRGGVAIYHEGNKKFRNEARKLRTVYEASTRADKRLVSLELVERVKAYGGRFLKRGQDGLWYDMNEDVAREKASQALRELKWVNKSAA